MWRHLRHFFVPHESNNHRAKALHVDMLLVYIFLFVLLQLGTKLLHATAPDILGYATDIRVEQLLQLTNEKRAEIGLSQLTLNSKLSDAAAKKAIDMLATNYWAHNSPVGKTPWDFIIASGYQYSVAGENLAKNFADSRGVVDAWMASSTHRANIVKPNYQEIGFAVVNGKLNGEETTLVVQMFGATKEAPVVQAPAPPPVVERPAVVEQEAHQLAPVAQVASAFGSVTKAPLISIPVIRREYIFLFIGMMMGILIVDAWLVVRRRIVRVAGHNIAHFLFFAALWILVSATFQGAII